MNILLILHHYLDRNAGAAGVTLRLAEQYERKGHKVYFFSFEDLPHWFSEKAESTVFPWFVASHIFKLVSQHPIDVIEAMTGDAWIWGTVWKNFSRNCPLLVTQSHGLEHTAHLQVLEDARQGRLTLSWKYPLWHGGFRLWEVAQSLRCADLVFMLNRQDATHAIEQLGISPERIHICPNGISEALLNLPFPDSSVAENRPIGIVQMGRYTAQKGIEYGVPALNAILRRYPNVKVSFLGTLCSAEQVYADFDPSIHDRIRVIPTYTNEQLPDLLQGHHIKLLPTLAEGFGLVIVEAMACGLAPVTTAIQGPLEIVTDGHDGLLVPVRDALAIEQALERLIRDRGYLETLRYNAYQTAQRYNWADIAQQRLTLFENLLEQRRHSK
jgi:glycosyltransferase involved in cell wall biosynthesis